MDTKLIIAMLISFVVGILMGRVSTAYRLIRSQKFLADASVLLDETKRLREEIGKTYDELKREGCFIRENDC